MNTVDVDRALPIVDSSQFLMMTADRRDSLMPLYTAPSVVPAVTSVVPALHTSSILGSSAYTSQAPGLMMAYTSHTSHGPAAAFPIGTYSGWGNAAMPMGYPNPTPALPTLWFHVLLVWQPTSTGRHFRFQPPPRLLFHHLRRQHQLQLNNRAARQRFPRPDERPQQLPLPRLPCYQSQPRRCQLF